MRLFAEISEIRTHKIIISVSQNNSSVKFEEFVVERRAKNGMHKTISALSAYCFSPEDFSNLNGEWNVVSK